jgi:hypothetical protein
MYSQGDRHSAGFFAMVVVHANFVVIGDPGRDGRSIVASETLFSLRLAIQITM